jgi:hypothetical protein
MRVKIWLERHCWPRLIILETAKMVVAKKRDGPPNSVAYFEKAIAKSLALSNAPPPTVNIVPRQVTAYVPAPRRGGISAAFEKLAARMDGDEEADR